MENKVGKRIRKMKNKILEKLDSHLNEKDRKQMNEV
jgi:hypothetical protein